MSQQIWVVSELYYPEETSTGYFLTKIAEGLANRFPVKVLCGQPSYSERGIRAPVREHRNGVYIRRCPAITVNKNILFLKLINLITITLSIFFTAVWLINRKDIVFVVTNPPLLPFAIMLACRLRGARYCLIVHDVYPEVLVATGILRQESIPTRFLQWLNDRLYRNAVKVLTLGRDMRAIALQKLDVKKDCAEIISNWADLKEIIPESRPKNNLLKELGLRDKFVIQYLGNIGRTHGIEYIVETAKKLGNLTVFHFLFVGSGAKKSWLENAIQKNNLKNTTILERQPRHNLSNTLNACDIAIISLIPGMAGVSVPSRMYNIMAAGKPIIAVADPKSELALVIQEEQIGWIVPPNQPERIIETILEAHQHPDSLLEMGQRARQAAETKYSFQHVIEAYYNLIDNLDDD